MAGTIDGRINGKVAREFTAIRPSSRFSGALPFATGPVGGDVVYGYFDGAGSQLRTLSSRDGRDRVLAVTDDIFHAAVADPDSNAIFVFSLDRTTRAPARIERVDRSTGARNLVVNLGTEPARARAQLVFRLFLAPGRLVLLDCADDRACRATVFDRETGVRLSQFETTGGDAVGVVDGGLVMLGGCRQPCSATAYDLTSGQASPLGMACGRATVSPSGGGSLFVGDQAVAGDCHSAGYAIQAFRADGRPAGPMVQLADRTRELISDGPRAGAELPAGWVLLGPSGQVVDSGGAGIGPLLVSLEDGHGIELPPPRPGP